MRSRHRVENDQTRFPDCFSKLVGVSRQQIRRAGDDIRPSAVGADMLVVGVHTLLDTFSRFGSYVHDSATANLPSAPRLTPSYGSGEVQHEEGLTRPRLAVENADLSLRQHALDDPWRAEVVLFVVRPFVYLEWAAQTVGARLVLRFVFFHQTAHRDLPARVAPKAVPGHVELLVGMLGGRRGPFECELSTRVAELVMHCCEHLKPMVVIRFVVRVTREQRFHLGGAFAYRLGGEGICGGIARRSLSSFRRRNPATP